MIALQLPPKVVDRLTELAANCGRTVDDYIFQIIVDHLEDVEDIASVEERLNSDDGVYYSLEEVMRELDADEERKQRPNDAAE